MRITELFTAQSIALDEALQTQEQILSRLVELQATHGGIFVFPVVDHAVLYCVALAVGSVLGAVILSLVKKTQPAEAK